jgi:hypothetical protein
MLVRPPHEVRAPQKAQRAPTRVAPTECGDGVPRSPRAPRGVKDNAFRKKISERPEFADPASPLKPRRQSLVYGARNEEWQRIRAHFPIGNEEDGEVDLDAFDGVGSEEVPGDEANDEVEHEDGERESEPGSDDGEGEEEGENEDDSSSDDQSPPQPPTSPWRAWARVGRTSCSAQLA